MGKHPRATYAITKFLYREIQHLSLNQKIYLDYEKSSQEKFLLQGIQPKDRGLVYR